MSLLYDSMSSVYCAQTAWNLQSLWISELLQYLFILASFLCLHSHNYMECLELLDFWFDAKVPVVNQCEMWWNAWVIPTWCFLQSEPICHASYLILFSLACWVSYNLGSLGSNLKLWDLGGVSVQSCCPFMGKLSKVQLGLCCWRVSVSSRAYNKNKKSKWVWFRHVTRRKLHGSLNPPGGATPR